MNIRKKFLKIRPVKKWWIFYYWECEDKIG